MVLLISVALLACTAGKDTAGTTQAVDSDGDGYSVALGDCDDQDPEVHPLADEWCDGIDNNCNHVVDESSAIDAATWYVDADQDGYGDVDQPQPGCSAPAGTVADATDCNDDDATIYPGADEIPCDGIAQSCTGWDGDRIVPDEYPVLQDAISDAMPGETICVYQGSYDAVVVDRALTIIARQGANRTEIVGNAGPALTVDAVSGLTVTGFTLTGGDAESGGGMLVQNSNNVWVQDCVFVDNSANQGGAAAILVSQDVIFQDSAFSRNHGANGGAIAIWGSDRVSIDNVTFINNEADHGGGSIYCKGSGFTMNQVDISSNRAEQGAGLYLDRCDLVATGGQISGNQALGSDKVVAAGGGLWALGGSVSFTDTEFSDNSPDDSYCVATIGC
ncbi:MAG: hypothetical protein GXP62_21610 [Oligoflexia bacterium]|nr:hypothetical protein [Oligoflexia bacterium]